LSLPHCRLRASLIRNLAENKGSRQQRNRTSGDEIVRIRGPRRTLARDLRPRSYARQNWNESNLHRARTTWRPSSAPLDPAAESKTATQAKLPESWPNYTPFQAHIWRFDSTPEVKPSNCIRKRVGGPPIRHDSGGDWMYRGALLTGPVIEPQIQCLFATRNTPPICTFTVYRKHAIGSCAVNWT
jgi:hypothetical protein